MLKRKEILFPVIGLAIIILLTVLITWIVVFNKATKLNNELPALEVKIYNAYEFRYQKVDILIDAIESANVQITSQITLITEARGRFADALSNNNLDDATGEIEIIESTLISLLSYMEDNPGNWTTVNLTRTYIAEIMAQTNAIEYAISNYNDTVVVFNNTVTTFPGNMFLRKFNKITNMFDANLLQKDLPRFN